MTDRLNDSQKRHLLVTFGHIDGLLTEALQTLIPSDPPSPLQRNYADSLPIQRKVISDYIAHLRRIMIHILESEDVAIPEPRVSAIWSFRTTLVCTRTALAELAPRYMQGYGPLPDDAARELEVAATRLLDIVDRMDSYLSEGAGQDLQTRVERLEKTVPEAGRIKTLEDVIAAHGLVDLRPPLGALVERLESSSFEVAVFGRVNSGKSSLLNHILRTDVLPVGVTPVTALPTRVVFGPRPAATIWFAEGKPLGIDPSELQSYVTEQGNPDNAKHVTRIQVELPADRLKEGITFVDTPGLGSLARYGEMETLAYLPRCDLGIVLIDATSTLNQEDVLTVNALLRAGVNTMVLLTKADVLSSDKQDTASRYIQGKLRDNLGIDLSVSVVSVRENYAELCDRWIETGLVPCLREHRKLAEVSLRRKIGLLHEATVAALTRQIDRGSAVSEGLAARSSAVEPLLNEALAKLDTARRERLDLPDLSKRILDAAAAEISELWRRRRTEHVNAARVVLAHGSQELNRLVESVATPLTRLRQDLTGTLGNAARSVGYDHEEETIIPPPTGMPLVDLSVLLDEALLRRPRLASLTRGAADRTARRQLAARFGPRLAGLLSHYVRQLEEWRRQALSDMRRSFTARAGYFRVRCEQDSSRSSPAAIENDLRRLRALQDRGGELCVNKNAS